jgi:hypothetical protein
MLALKRQRPRKSRASLRLHRPLPDPDPDLGLQVWQHKGEMIAVVLWSAEAFAALQDPPEDALQFPGGCWGRMIFVSA